MNEIHLKDLLKIPKRTWVKLEDKFRKELFTRACLACGETFYGFAKKMHKMLGVSNGEVYAWYKGERLNKDCTRKIEHGIQLNNLVHIAKIANIEMEEIEKHIKFIKGDGPAGKIFNPKFPIKLNKAVASVIGHTLHDGYLEPGKLRVVYSNKDSDNLKHFKENVIRMFDTKKIEFGEIKSKGGIRIDVPNIAGYVLVLFGLQPGDKLKNDAGIPKCLLECGDLEIVSDFIESTIADEMSVVNHKYQVGGNINMSLSSLKNKPSQLLLDDIIIFKKLGIRPTRPRLALVKTIKNGQARYRWEFYICGQRNLSVINSLITIPIKRKQKILLNTLKSYTKLYDAILLDKQFRINLFNEAISKYETIMELSNFLTNRLQFNISEGSMHDWRKGRYHCPISVIFELARMCNRSINDLIKDTVTYKSHKLEKPFEPDENFLNEMLAKLSNSLNQSS